MTFASHTPPVQNGLAEANRHALRALQRQWLLAALLSLPMLAAAYLALTKTSFAAYAHRWLLLASLVAAIELAILWRVLPRMHHPGESKLLARFGLGVWLTLSGALLLAYLTGFLFSPWPSGWLAWAPAALYLASRIIDLFDGYAARINDHATEAGATLDIEYDGIGLLLAVALGVQYNQLPVWYLLLAISRQLFVAGMWWRKRSGKPVYDLPPSDNRRITAGCQTSFIAAALWPILAPPETILAAYVFAIPLVASFSRDWLVVSGAVDPESTAYLRCRSAVKQVGESWLPLVARLIGGLVGAAILVRIAPAFVTTDAMPASMLVILISTALVLFSMGIAGRISALFVIALAVFDMQTSGLQWYGNALLLVSAIVVFHFGSGRYSLWQPEEPFLHRRLGETASQTAYVK